MDEVKKLRRPKIGRSLFGVCAGLAKFTGIDVGTIRLVWALLALFGGINVILAYFIAWIVIPEEE